MSKTSKELVKRLLAVALTLVMVIGFMPVAAIPVYATEIGAEETPAPSTEPTQTPEPSTEPTQTPAPTTTPTLEPLGMQLEDNLYLYVTAIENLSYTGRAQGLVNAKFLDAKGEAAKASGYSVKYSINGGSEKSKAEGTNAGTYEVTYIAKKIGTEDKSGTVSVTIAQAESWTGDIKAKENLEYTGEEQLLIDEVDLSDCSVSYKLNDEACDDYASVVGKDAGEYKVTVSVQKLNRGKTAPDVNYKATEKTETVKIEAAEAEISVWKGQGEWTEDANIKKEDILVYNVGKKVSLWVHDYNPDVMGEITVTASIDGKEVTTDDQIDCKYDSNKQEIVITVKTQGSYTITVKKTPAEDEKNFCESTRTVKIEAIVEEANEEIKISLKDSTGKDIPNGTVLNRGIFSGAKVAVKRGNLGAIDFKFTSAPDGLVKKNNNVYFSRRESPDKEKTLDVQFNDQMLFELAKAKKIEVTATGTYMVWENYIYVDKTAENTATLELKVDEAPVELIITGETTIENCYFKAKDENGEDIKLTIAAPEGYTILGYTATDKANGGEISVLVNDVSFKLENSVDGINVYLVDESGNVSVKTLPIKYSANAPEVTVDAKLTDDSLIKQIITNILFGVGKKDDGANSYTISFKPEDKSGHGIDRVEYKIYKMSLVDLKGFYKDYEEKLKDYNTAKTEYENYLEEKKAGTWDSSKGDLTPPVEPNNNPFVNATLEEDKVTEDKKFKLDISDSYICMIEYQAFDNCGNSSTVHTMGNYDPDKLETPYNYLVIDNTPPKITITVSVAEGTVKEVEQGEDKLYYINSGVTIKAEIKEENYALSAEGFKLLVDNTTSIVDGGKDDANKDECIVEYSINSEGKHTVSADYTDPSGNVAKVTVKIGGFDADTFVIDTTKPTVEIKGNPDGKTYSVDKEKNPEQINGKTVYYYNSDANFTANVTETNIGTTTVTVNKVKPDNLNLKPQDDGGNVAFTITGEKDEEIQLKSEDISAVHEDKAGNKNDPAYFNGIVVIDMLKPSLKVTLNNAANTVGGTHYYNGSINAAFEVTETYFANNLMQVKVKGGESNDIGLTFAPENGTNHKATHTLTEDGNYKLTVTGADKAGNEMDKYESEDLVIDTQITAPTISGVEPGHAYKDKDISVSVTGQDTNFDQMTVVITKTYMANENGKTVQRTAEVYNETFYTGNTYSYRVPDGRDADGIYVVTATIRDKATNTATSTPVTFTVNRYGSVYEYVSGITEVNGKYVQKVGEELVIWEYSATELEGNNESLMKNVGIYADGSKIDASDIKVELEHQNGGWYKYIYTIPTVNFDTDAHYKVEISSESVNGVRSSNTKIQNLVAIDFFKDGTAPVLENVTGMEKSIYNEAEHEIKFNIYDSIGLASVKVLVNNEEVFSKEDFEDAMNYEGSITLDESDSKQHVRFIITDLAGNVTDTDADGFDPDYTFERDLTVSTNFFVRLRANTPLLIGCIAGVVVILALGVILIIRKKDKKEEEKTAAAK